MVRVDEPELRHWPSMKVRSSAHSNLHAQSPALLRHSLTDVCQLDILSRRRVRAISPHPRRLSFTFSRGPRYLMAEDAGPAVVGEGRDTGCAAMAGPQCTCHAPLTPCCSRALQDRSRHYLDVRRRSWASRRPTLRGACGSIRLVARNRCSGECGSRESALGVCGRMCQKMHHVPCRI